MFKRAVLFALVFQAGWCATAQRPQLLVVGSAHLNNPGHDIFNVVADDVLTPKRQAEIAAIVDRLAHFQPTHVALECTPDKQEFFDQRYGEYRAGRYALSRDEREQIGMRLAAKLKLQHVDCVDYQGGSPGPEDAYNFMTYAQAHAETRTIVDAMMTMGKRLSTEETAFLQSHPLIEWYRRANEPIRLQDSNQVYVQYIADLGDASEHPGANWVGGWHARNLIIVENLRRLAKPDDRVVALFGVGHAYLLHEFATESAAFHVVDTETYLR